MLQKQKLKTQLTPENTIEHVDKDTGLSFKCVQCGYINATERGLAQHARTRHRISQLDGQTDTVEENFEEVDVVTLELDEVDRGHC